MNLIPTRRPPLALSTLMLGLVLLLPACGGGGGATDVAAAGTTPTAQVQTALYFTDDFSAAYDAVWISVSRVTVVSPAGETELVRHATPQLLNLPTLRRSGALVAQASLPSDATEVRVYVAGTAQLQQLDGSLRDVGLQAPAGYLAFRLEGWDSRSGALALDFDLPNFSLQGNTLVAATRLAGSADLAGWNGRHTEVRGTVTAVSAGSITVQTQTLGAQTFTLDAQTTFLSERSAGWLPAVGDVVELSGGVSGQGAQALQFSARQVKDRSDAGSTGSAKVHGVVTAVVNGLITVGVDRSNLAGATGSIQIDVGQARFKRGSAALLAPGLRIEAYLVADAGGNGYRATVVEIEGAAKTRSDTDGDTGVGDDVGYGEVKGTVRSIDGRQVVLTALHARNLPSVLQGSALTLDLGSAYFERGDLACVVAGTPIEVKGAVTAAGQLRAVKVELEGGCASAYPVSGVQGPATPTNAVVGIRFVEAKGLVTAVRAGEFDLQVYKVEAVGAVPAALTVRHGAGTLFKRLAGGQLAAGQFLEIKGNLQAGVLDATKIELD